MRNTKRELSWSIKREILTEFSWSLYRSGYPEQFRLEVISSGISAYEMKCARADARVAPLHRDRHWDKEGRRKKKLLARTSWYRHGRSWPRPSKRLLMRRERGWT